MPIEISKYIKDKGYDDAKECHKAGGSIRDIGFCCSYKNKLHQQYYLEGWFKYWDTLKK